MPETTSSASQKGRIFISYRRTDSAGYAGRIYDRFVAYFGEDAVFMDVDTIEGGTDFIRVLEDAVQSCDVLIALIGRQWLSVKDKDGKRRLDDPEDFVRIEIATALKRNIRVIPVLVDGVDMPQPTELPENIKDLARRNALQVNHHSFNPDVYRLIEHTKSALDEAAEKAKQRAAKKLMDRKTAEKAKRERAERRSAQIAALKENIARTIPTLRVAGFAGIAIVLVLISLWGSPKLASFVPIAKGSSTPSLRPTATAGFSFSSINPTKTLTLEPTSTKTQTPAPTVTLASEITDTKDVSMMLVPAGEFTMGASADHALEECQKIARFCNRDWFINQSPSHQVYLDAFYMDKYEVTNNLYRACVNAGVCKPPNSLKSNTHPTYYSNPKYGNYPVLFVDWNQAKIYCEWRDEGLPTEAQWEKAARGTDARTYPWGEGITCKEANIFGCIADTQEVGSYESGKSPYGIYDLAGNLSEWVADWYAENYYSSSSSFNPLGSDSGQYRVARGGSWASVVELELAAYIRSMYDPNSQGANIGFRCARSTP